MTNGVEHQLARGMQFELLKDIAAVRLYGPRTEIQVISQILGGFSNCDKLDNFTLTGCQKRDGAALDCHFILKAQVILEQARRGM
jgi:hypothetical protein